jgi:predicted anti-sigma-YlaC factor YlaD
MMMCKEATRLMSLRQDRPLKFRERLSLRLHLSMCSACRECDRQFELLHKAGQHKASASEGTDEERRAP